MSIFNSSKSTIINSFNSFSSHSSGNNFSFSNNSGSTEGIVGNGVMKIKNLPLKNFDRLLHTGFMDVSIVIGDTYSVELAAEENLIDLIKCTTTGDTLNIGFTENISFSTNKPITAKITMPSLKNIQTMGSGDTSVENLNESSFIATMQGSGDLLLQGKADRANITLRGNGDIVATALIVKSLTVLLMGNGDIEALASETLDAKLMGNGDIDIIGNPKNILSKQVYGNGDITIK